ncbi:SDR family oxidoreductase [Candidatus Viridilinea mediisalina]|uniref:NAD(P)-dependent oxidoreductase n=1 Tax=Candidatus Viridilinea mediisalina TaxID=2024553 RepID=A0A2A6RFS6_9CHLR|nr:SDR family oxidoreductase [Candidatus Viridilinea mediisalina]PDW01984.1 NAD(P)-dependent oxidoreductase [Candidatus Viridilinea mediisalina]
MSRRLLITGGTGYLGSVLVRQSAALGDTVAATYYSNMPPPQPGVIWLPLDVRDDLAVFQALDELRPDLVIHTAFQQTGPDLMSITADGAGHVATAAARCNARLIHMSSDVIFDGEAERAYHEADPPAPISAYGAAKARAEALVSSAHPQAVLVRTSLIYGFDPIDRISRFTLDVARGQIQAQLFSDEYRCPIYVEDLASALLELCDLPYQGILNIAGAERVSRYELGTLIARAWGLDPTSIPAGLSASQATPRPRNCTLNISRAQALLKTPLRGIRAVLRAVEAGER